MGQGLGVQGRKLLGTGLQMWVWVEEDAGRALAGSGILRTCLLLMHVSSTWRAVTPWPVGQHSAWVQGCHLANVNVHVSMSLRKTWLP